MNHLNTGQTQAASSWDMNEANTQVLRTADAETTFRVLLQQLVSPHRPSFEMFWTIQQK